MFVLVLVLLVAAVAGCELGSPAGAGGAVRAEVLDVTDGDTIDVAIGGRERAVRLVGIDTPEVFFGVECGGEAASRALERMVQPGDRVRLVRDRSQDNRDAYDRLLRYVEHGGRDLGRVQIRRGHAAVYVFENPFQRLRSYERAERRAESAGAGVWGACGGDFHDPLWAVRRASGSSICAGQSAVKQSSITTMRPNGSIAITVPVWPARR